MTKSIKEHRYVSGKRPDYAPISRSGDESEDDDFIEQKRRRLTGRHVSPAEAVEQDVEATGEVDLDDSRLRRKITKETKVKMRTGWSGIGISMHQKSSTQGRQMRRSIALPEWLKVGRKRRRKS
jgi:microfibrillar-associated protein 1